MDDSSTIGGAIKEGISDRFKATLTGFKEKVDPLNIAKTLTFGSSLGPALLGKLLGRSKEDISYFTGMSGQKKRKKGLNPLIANKVTDNPDASVRVGDPFADALGRIYALFKATMERDKLQSEIQNDFKSEQREIIRNHKDVIKTIKMVSAHNKKALQDVKDSIKKEEPPTTPSIPSGKPVIPKPPAAGKPPGIPRVRPTAAPKPTAAPRVRPTAAPKPTAAPRVRPTAAPKAPTGGKPSTARRLRKPTAVQLGTITAALVAGGITNSYAQNAIVAKVSQESGFVSQSEDLDYTAERMMVKWPNRFKTLESAKPYEHNPEKLAEFVYGRRMGNNKSGEGFKYRGRGYIQLTGKDRYAAFGKAIGVDLVNNPDLANDPKYASRIMTEYLKLNVRGINNFKTQAEANRAITQAIAGPKLNLDKGDGKTLLDEVNTFTNTISDNSIGTIINTSSTSNRDLKEQLADNNTLVLINNNTAIVKQGDRTTRVYQQRPSYQEAAMLQAQRG
jgi:predicted chitinase